MRSILIVEDDLTFALMLSTWLNKKGFRAKSTSSIAEARRLLEGELFDLILSDLRLPDGDGLELLGWMKKRSPKVPVILMTGYAEVQNAVLAIKSGAADYVAKPLNPDELLAKINETLSSKADFAASASNGNGVSSLPKPNLYIEGQSRAARLLYEHVRLVAPTDMSVLITGASGTGKEYVARRIHAQSSRAKAPFVAVDCGAIPKELAASEFFGHVKGSFTGAIDHKTGAFVAAQGGTIFLDEIGNLSYEVQVQLLRALQERKVRPIGSNQEIPINVRLVSATNENLRSAIEKGDFREDLYHRINEFTIRIPGLSERQEDLLLFANHFLDLANSELRKEVVGFDAETIRLFQSYAWPGNLRQMKNVVKYATLLCSGRYITRHELPEELLETIGQPKPAIADFALRGEEHERTMILRALEECGNNKTRAAMLLGIDRKTLYNKLKLYDL